LRRNVSHSATLEEVFFAVAGDAISDVSPDPSTSADTSPAEKQGEAP